MDTVVFTTKGQVVIPVQLRRQFEIHTGTRAVVEATPEGILLKPITRHAIEKLHGILKRKDEDEPFEKEWARYKKEEKKLESRRPRNKGF